MPAEKLAQEYIKAQVLAEAEAEITELLTAAAEWQVSHPEATWDEIELQVLQLRQRFGVQLGGVLARQRQERQPVPGPCCPECGEEMRYKGPKERRLMSMLGEVPLERGYYYCSACRRGVFPPG